MIYIDIVLAVTIPYKEELTKKQNILPKQKPFLRIESKVTTFFITQ